MAAIKAATLINRQRRGRQLDEGSPPGRDHLFTLIPVFPAMHDDLWTSLPEVRDQPRAS
ncbi:hypothetical protein LL947_06995 [Halomonas sp. BLK-85]